jgi:F-type H+-transporting ATPase subunit delta
MKRKTATLYAEALFEVTENVTDQERLKLIIADFFKMIVRHQREQDAVEIITEFEHLQKKNAGIIEAEITTAFALSDEVKIDIAKNLGEKVEITGRVDASILGGIIVKTNDLILDGSLKTQLTKLKNALVS